MIPDIKRFGTYWIILAVVKEFLYLLYTVVFDVVINIDHFRWVLGLSFIGAVLWYAIWYAEHPDKKEGEEK